MVLKRLTAKTLKDSSSQYNEIIKSHTLNCRLSIDNIFEYVKVIFQAATKSVQM